MEAKIARVHTDTVSLDTQWIINILETWSRNYATRRELRELDDHQLTDIGIDRISARHESNKPFWQD